MRGRRKSWALIALVASLGITVGAVVAQTERSTGNDKVAVIGAESITLLRLDKPPVDCKTVPTDRVVLAWDAKSDALMVCIDHAWKPYLTR